ncbi:probable ubiquitin-specific processing protease 21 [Cephalotrichum gorgonifer]|uniref:ubiquitinyl hydrolase 1 n=1 Tax=Cephalotrichum gorgonifer TaxID=2041049 RepID=A0AAE8MPM6_9PEZI|nr:probable ubiquitin-specific processing protease 21 [Cephalotrichum gorgonifer]
MTQSHDENIQSPNGMVLDTNDYVGVADPLEKDDIAIISTNTPDTETDQLPEPPRADDYEALKELVLPPLPEDPPILEDAVHTWSIEAWNSLSKKEHGPTFEAGGHPWRILLFPYGNNVDQCSIYLEHGYGTATPKDFSCCVQFGLVLWNPNDPSLYCYHHAHHRFTKDEGDWGFTRFLELRKMFNVAWDKSSRPLIENEAANITVFARIVKDETGVLWHNFNVYDSKTETGYVGLKNQGATCYLNSLLQSLYFTNAFRKAIYEIPTEDDATMSNSAYTLQRLFYQLQTSHVAVSTSELTKSFGWETRHIFEQQDVQELSRKLMERMEERMKGTKGENVLPQLFSGKIKTYISCINVDYESSRVEDFWDIQLNVSGNKDVLEGFQDYIQVEKLIGENQYYAGEDFKLQDANKGVIFTSFPDVLHLQLKRFEYDIQRDAMMKVNTRYEFPETFDAAPFLTEDADMSEPWVYQLHGVLVHSGDLNAGHYYAFLKPEKDGWFYKYDDDRVTRATMREVLEENFGGEYPPSVTSRGQLQKRAPIMRQNSAYMLVYIRQSRVDRVLTPVTENDIPKHLKERLESEEMEREKLYREQQEAHLFMNVKVVNPETFKNYGATDLASFDADAKADEGASWNYRVKRAMLLKEFLEMVGKGLGEDPKKLRAWIMVNRQNKTVRPDVPVTNLEASMETLYSRVNNQREAALRLWVEVASEVDAEGNGIFPKNDHLLLFLKCFDIQTQTLRGAGQVYIHKDKKVDDIVPAIMQRMGWGEKLRSDERVFMWEEIKPTMIEPLKAKQTLKAAELQDGDIICFQRFTDPKSDRGKEEKRKADAERHEDLNKLAKDYFENACEYYDFLYNKKTIKFAAHPTRCDDSKYPPFELTMSAKNNYDDVAERAGAMLNVPPTHIRFWTVNNTTGNPKTPIKRSPTSNLLSMLHTGAYTQSQQNYRADAFFFEVLEISLEELEFKKNIKLTWLTEGITKEETFDLLVNKNGTVEDLINALIHKAKIPDEAEAGRIRIFEASNSRFFRELKRDYPVVSMNEYTTVYAERVPEEERQCEEANLINVFHFQNEPSRVHGIPFRFLLVENEPFSETKKRMEKRTGFKGKMFEKIKFSVVRRSHYSKPQYLNDDDVLWHVASSDDDLLGLDHLDRTRVPRNGTDLFLK